MVLLVYGTRPEIIKLSPIISRLSHEGIPFKTVFTGQHQDLFEDVKSLIPSPDFNLNCNRKNESTNKLITDIISTLEPVLSIVSPKICIVQGDTASAFAAALCCFNNSITIGHVEAGLRTYNLQNPFPEEANRQMISRLAGLHWAPTQIAYENLKNEGINNVLLTGNTVIDACRALDYKISYENKVLITLHRRENYGAPMHKMFKSINDLALEHKDLEFIFPMHPAPEIQKHKYLLDKVSIISALQYQAFLKLLSQVKFVISDSGGIQEECAHFKKKILVCRHYTERPEGLKLGLSKLVGADISNHFNWALVNPEWEGENPYGDGHASQRIALNIKEFLNDKIFIA